MVNQHAEHRFGRETARRWQQLLVKALALRAAKSTTCAAIYNSTTRCCCRYRLSRPLSSVVISTPEYQVPRMVVIDSFTVYGIPYYSTVVHASATGRSPAVSATTCPTTRRYQEHYVDLRYDCRVNRIFELLKYEYIRTEVLLLLLL